MAVRGGKEERRAGNERRSHTITSADLLRSYPWRTVGKTSDERRKEGEREGENGVGELSAIPGHKSTCTYRIASESFLYIPCSPQVLPSSFSPTSIRAVFGFLLTPPVIDISAGLSHVHGVSCTDYAKFDERSFSSVFFLFLFFLFMDSRLTFSRS